ncbi:MAG: LysR family transcriptional regulator [Pseudomonadota bacterium]
MKPSPYHIAAFTQVARARSFSRAAEAMGLTQSAVTQHVAKLERTMGAQLFVRRRDGLELTSAGRDLFDISDRMLALEQQIAEKVAAYSDLSAGSLRIIANAPRPAMPILSEYSRLYPEVQIFFSLVPWSVAMETVLARDADIAIITEPDPVPGAMVLELERTCYRARMRQEHPLASRPEVTLSDLSHELLVLPEDGSLTQRLVRQKMADHGQAMRRVIQTATFPLVREALLHGIGIGVLLENSMFPSRQLVSVPIREMPETYGHCLVTPSDKSDLRAVQSFTDIARQLYTDPVVRRA